VQTVKYSPDDEMELVCTDKFARLRDTWIETERVYGYAQGVNATKGCLVWRYDMAALALNELVVPSEKKFNGRFYRVSAVSGPQSAVEPVWPTGGCSTVVSGGVTFTESGAVSDSTGTATFQRTLRAAPNSTGGVASGATPLPSGPRQCPHCSRSAAIPEHWKTHACTKSTIATEAKHRMVGVPGADVQNRRAADRCGRRRLGQISLAIRGRLPPCQRLAGTVAPLVTALLGPWDRTRRRTVSLF
jgi:hypothetical protein